MHLLALFPLLFPLPSQQPAAPAPAAAKPAPLAVGQPAPDLQIARWLAEPKKPGSVSSSSGTGKRGEALVTGPAPRWSNHHEAKIVFHAPLAATLPVLAEFAEAGSDRGLALVGWTVADDEKQATETTRRLGDGVALGVPADGSPLHPLAPELLVIGPSGELVWCGTAAQEKELVAAVGEALSRPCAKPLGAPLAPELAPALADYWDGNWAKARAAAEKLAKKAEGQVAGDAKRLAGAVDEYERELGIAADDAAGKGQMHELVEIEALLSAGLPGAVQKRVSEKVKEISGKSLQGGSADDARKWLEIAARRPLFFPVRNEPAGERYAHELEQFVKRSSNLTGPQQRALALVERWKQRKPR